MLNGSIIFHRSGQGGSVDDFAVLFEMVFSGTHRAQRITLVGVNHRKGKSASFMIAMSDEGFGYRTGKAVIAPGVKSVAAGKGGLGLRGKLQPFRNQIRRLIPDVSIGFKKFVTDRDIERLKMLFPTGRTAVSRNAIGCWFG